MSASPRRPIVAALTITATLAASAALAACGGDDGDTVAVPGAADPGASGDPSSESDPDTGDDPNTDTDTDTGSDGTDGDGTDSSDTVPAPTAGDGRAVLEVFGTTPAAPVDGFVAVDSDCGQAFSVEEPGFADVDVQLPPTWNAVGIGDGIRFERDGAERNLTASVFENAGPLDLDAVAAGGGGGEPIGSITWGAQSYPVYFDGVVARTYAPAMRTVSPTFGEVNWVFEARFGSTGSGDTLAFGQDEILAVLDSMSLNACVADQFAPMLDAEIVIVD